MKILVFLFIFSPLYFISQNYADPEFYLLDSVDVSEFSETDLELLDSCLNVFHSDKIDTNKLNALYVVSMNVWYPSVSKGYNEFTLQFAEEKLKQSNLSEEEIFIYKFVISETLYTLGYIIQENGNVPLALDYYHASFEISKEIDLKKSLAIGYNNIGFVYHQQGDIAKALEYHHKSLNIKTELGDSIGMGNSINNIGFLYNSQQDYDKGIEYCSKALKIYKSQNHEAGMAYSLNNLGLAYKQKENYDEALVCYEQSLEIRTKLDDLKGMGTVVNNIAKIYHEQKKYTKALEFFNESLEIAGQVNDAKGIAIAHSNIGNVYLDQGEISLAKKHGGLSLVEGQKLGYPNVIYRTAELLKKVAKEAGNWEEAYTMLHLENEMLDSLNSQKNIKAQEEQHAKFKYAKKAAADSTKAAEAAKVMDAKLKAEIAENKRNELESKRQKEQKYYLFGGLALTLLFAGFIFNRFRTANKQKSIIEKQKAEVENQKEVIEEAHKEITDSIQYAKRIQSAILPPMDLIKSHLKNSFVLYKPKDIVAGDFYWLEHKDGKTLFAACDCTGHGVPGAMVSVVCVNGLNRAVREHNITEPGEILDKTREIVLQEFEKSEEEVKDGMDLALCSLDGTTLKYAGAHNPLWIIRKGTSEVIEIKANKQPIGKHDNPLPYTTHEIELGSGDSFYIFSDGFADQFGGEKEKKLKTSNFKKLLVSIQHESMDKQLELIDNAFEKWKGPIEQLDDVCVIGVRV